MMHDSRMIQALHAAISRSSWSEVERAAHALRDDEQSARKILAGTDIGSLPHDMTTADMAKRRMATISTLTAERDALIRERDNIADANHRQAFCIHQCAAHIGPDTAGTLDGLPKAVARVVRERDEARELVERAQAIISTSTYPNWHAAAEFALAENSVLKPESSAARTPFSGPSSRAYSEIETDD